MKPFEFYSTIEAKYPDYNGYKRELRKQIDESPMTAAERKAAIEEIPGKVHNWYAREVAPYNAEQAEKMLIFWQDCRKELGYDQFLSLAGCGVLESYAWEQGHSAGFSEVYNYLIDLAELAKTLINNRREKDGN